MKEKIRILNKFEEQKRATETLLKGECFISRIPLNDKDYEFVYHTGADSFVFVASEYLTTDKETTDAQLLQGQPSP